MTQTAMAYDSFNIPGTSDHVQLKVGPCELNMYFISDKVSVINDGVYLSDSGVIVITDGVYAAYHPHAIDKWGGILDTGEIVKGRNPMIQALQEENLIPIKNCMEEECTVEEWKRFFTGLDAKYHNLATSMPQKESLVPIKDVHQRLVEEWRCLFNQCIAAGFTNDRAFELVKAHILSSGKQ